MIKSRRSFLSLLGLGAAAAPLVAKTACAESSPLAKSYNSAFNTGVFAPYPSTMTISDPGHTHGISYARFDPREGDRQRMLVIQTHGHGYDDALHEYRSSAWHRVSERKV